MKEILLTLKFNTTIEIDPDIRGNATATAKLFANALLESVTITLMATVMLKSQM